MSIRHYVLLATDGFINLPGQKEPVYIFGFTGGLYKVDNKVINSDLDWTNSENWTKLTEKLNKATIPSPMIWAEVGDDLYITLINLGMPITNLSDFHTVHMHGAHVATQVDGFPESSFGVPMWEDYSTVPPSATYYFKPEHPGTLMYHCHVEASEHVQMGMYGALIIYPSKESLKKSGIKQHKNGTWSYYDIPQPNIPKTATNRNFAYNDIDSYFDKEYVMLLSDLDTNWHHSVQQGAKFNPVDFKPNYWLVNGRAFPDTLLPHPQTAPEGSNPDLVQINYESYVHVKTGQQFLLRMINMGYQVVPWHIHGWHFMVIGKDSNPSPFLKISRKLGLQGHNGKEMGFTATIGSGETYDLLIMAEDKSNLYRNYIVNGENGISSLCSQMHSIYKLAPDAIANIPTEPINNPDTVNYIEICDEDERNPDKKFFPQFYPMHNHDDYKVTNDGVYPGGQLTYIQTDAPINNKKDNK